MGERKNTLATWGVALEYFHVFRCLKLNRFPLSPVKWQTIPWGSSYLKVSKTGIARWSWQPFPQGSGDLWLLWFLKPLWIPLIVQHQVAHLKAAYGCKRSSTPWSLGTETSAEVCVQAELVFRHFPIPCASLTYQYHGNQENPELADFGDNIVAWERACFCKSRLPSQGLPAAP